MKTFVIVLILLAALFAVGVAVGASRAERKSSASSHEPGGFEKALDGLFRPLKPRAKLGVSSFPCGGSVDVPPAKDKTRTLKLRLSKGCVATLTYQRAATTEPSDMDRQAWPDDETKDRTQTSFVIFKEGGRIVSGGHSGCRVSVVED